MTPEEKRTEEALAAYEAGKLVGQVQGLKQGLAIAVAFVTLFAIIALLVIKNS